MARDLGRDLDIGQPPKPTLNINVLAAAPIITAMQESDVKVEEVKTMSAKLLRTSERILGQDMTFDEDNLDEV